MEKIKLRYFGIYLIVIKNNNSSPTVILFEDVGLCVLNITKHFESYIWSDTVLLQNEFMCNQWKSRRYKNR
jgi:hypothetical protein